MGKTRSKGLRREDIAHLTHVSLTWYTWLEQGRDISVSTRFLSRLARVLHLSDAEQRYLFRLCGHPAPRPAAVTSIQEISPSLERMLQSMRGVAFAINIRWDIVAANRYAEALFGMEMPRHGPRLNVLKLLFLDEVHRRMVADWDKVARKAAAKFRLDASEHGTPEMQALVAELRAASAEFDRFWQEAEVSSRQEENRIFLHPKLGEISLSYLLFDISGRPDLRLNVYVGSDEENDLKLGQLIHAARPMNRAA